MQWKQHNPEEVVYKLERVRAAMAKGASLIEAIAHEDISESTYFRWKAQYGGLTPVQMRRLKELELENARLRRLLVDLEAPALARQA
ncbi:MAG: transposase [Terricaulis sp.]